MIHEAIKQIKLNRISTTEICDVLGKTGNLPDILPVNPGQHIVGELQYFFAHSSSNYNLHRQLEKAKLDKIVFVDAINCEQKAVFGDLVAKYLVLYKGVRGIVTNGYMRDLNDLIKEKRPVWCTGHTPIGCENVDLTVGDKESAYADKRSKELNGALIIADDSGVAVVPKSKIDDNFLKSLQFIEAQEDIWYYCIDHLKWSTYETVALKRYLDEPEHIPASLLEKLKK